MPETEVLTAKEAEDRIKKGGLSLGGATIEGSLFLGGTTIKGGLDLRGATIEGGLFLGGATIKGGLDLEGATIEGFLDLEGVTIEGGLNLSLKEGPTRIYVSQELAQLIHWSAPTVPLVVVK